MAQTSFPFENIDTTETQFSQMFRNLQDGVNGTYGGTELKVVAGTGLAVDVPAGQAMVRGHYYINDATESLALATADATNGRLDVVVLRLDPSANTVVLAVKTGTPAGSPSAPALVQTDAGIFEFPLANVLVPATSGVPTTITDRRVFMGTRIGLWSDSTRPTTEVPHVGFNTTGGTFEGYDPATETWGPIGGGGGVTISSTAPGDPSEGDLWWDSDDGKLYVYYNDGTSSQWVDAAGPSVAVQSTAPTGYEGQLWLDDTDGSMYVYYTDPGGGSSSWIGAVSRSGGILQVVSTTKTDTFTASVGARPTISGAVTGLTATITPRSTSSKILVMAEVSVSTSSANDGVFLHLYRDGSLTGWAGDTAGSRQRNSRLLVASNSTQILAPIMYLDSPSTTSSITYDIRLSHDDSGTASVYVNRSEADTDAATHGRGVSSITLIEVAG